MLILISFPLLNLKKNTLGFSNVDGLKLKLDVLCILPACCAGMRNCFRCRIFVHLKCQVEWCKVPSPLCPSPGLVSQLFPEEPVSSRPLPWWQLLGAPAVSVLSCPSAWGCRMLQKLQSKGLYSCSGSGLEGFPPPSPFFFYFVLFLFL